MAVGGANRSEETSVARATGIGGVFFKTSDPERLRDWYVEYLGLPIDDGGYVVMRWGGDVAGSTVWAPYPADTTAFEWPADRQWMIDYRVDDLDGMRAKLRANGVAME